MNNMATLELKTDSKLSTNGEPAFSLCTFCNKSTNGFEKRLFATQQPKGPFFPVLAELHGKKTKLDDLGRAVVCVACFHHLLRQWSSYERRGIPVRMREYNIITDDRVNNYQVRREEEIRKEAEDKIKEVHDREERIRKEAEERIEKYRQRQAEIRREAEKRLLEEQAKAEEFKKKTSSKLREEQQREEELRRQAEQRIQEEKEKKEYIRQEAERLLREEKLLESQGTKQLSTSSSPEIVTTYRTEVIIPSPERENAPLRENTDQTESEDMEGVASEKERKARSQRRKMMVYDPETGCYRKAQSDEENPVVETKTERVEYRFRLKSDEKPRKATEDKDSSSKPDEASEDVTVSMEPVQFTTEQTIVLNGKGRSRGQGREDDAGDEEDIKKAGDIMKARFEEGRKRFEQETVERKRSDSSKQRTRAPSDDSLEDKIKEMEKRRERLLLRGPSGSVETQARRPSEEGKDLSPKAEPESPRDGSKSPADETTKKQRSRSERNKRRLTAEELSLKKSSGSEEDLTSRTSGADAAKIPKTDPEKQTETKTESYSIQLKKVEKPDKPDDEVFVTQVKPVEASVNLMSWDDSTDGPVSVPEKDPPHREGFRKRADSAEGEMFPRPMKLVEIEAPISVVQKGEVESSPDVANLLDLDEPNSSMSSATAIEPISTWENRARASSNSAEEDRRRREREHEERKRRIEENQRRAAKELKAKKQGESDVSPQIDAPVREMSMKEKRRSLVDMWESLAESQTNVMSFEEDEQMSEDQSYTAIVGEKRTVLFDPLEDRDSEGDMEVGDIEVVTSTRPSVETEKNTNLTEEEQRWESAGHFQPGRLQKTVFHSLSQAAPADEQPKPMPRKVGSRYDWMKGETSADQAALVPTKLNLDWQSSPAADEKLSNGQRESSPEPIQMEIKTQSRDAESSSESSSESDRGNEIESESEEERIPRVDSDEFHRLTEEEKHWERAGHFQPKKLNLDLMVGFQQAPEEEKPLPKKTQTTSAPAKFKVEEPKREEPEIEEISPVSEVKTETEPDILALCAHVYEEESDDEDDIPGWRKMEEKRRQQEREEIERAKLEEKRRMEREALEENLQQESDSSDDEFEAKVRTREIRRINPNLLGQFMKEPEKEPEKPLKSAKAPPKEQRIDRSNVEVSESTPVVDSPFEDVHEREREVEDEYEEKVKSRQIRKLKLDDMPFLQAKEQDTVPVPHRDVPRASRITVQEERYVQDVQRSTVESAPTREWEEEPDEPEVGTYEEESEDDDVPEWRKMEERRRQQEQEEIARARLEEQRRMEREAQESEEQDDTDSVDDEFEAKVKTKEIRRINPNLLVQFLSQDKEEVPSTRKPKKETIETQRVSVTETAPQDVSDYVKEIDDYVDDEFELKVKTRQVNKLVLDKSPFMQKHTTEEVPVARTRSDADKSRKVSNKDATTPVVQEDVLVQVVHDEVVESQPELSLHEAGEDDEFEVKIKSRDVKKLDQNQFVFLRKQEEEERRRLQEEERRRVEREERELLRKEEERRRRLEAEARAREEERMHREEEMRRREEEERAHREEEKRRRLEEAERLRQEEEERLRKEEEEELMRFEEMRRQKQAAKLKFESGSFDDVTVTRSEKDIYSVGRLDSTKFMQFQQTPPEEPKPKSRPRMEKKKTEEYMIPEREVETVEVASVDLIESSPYEENLESGPTEDELYEDKRKSVGKLDKDWFLKQQQIQEEENARRTKDLEEQRLREERNEMLRIKGEDSKRLEYDDSTADTRERSNSEKRRSKLAADKFSPFAHEGGAEPEKPRIVKEGSITVERKDEVETGPSVRYGDEDVVILGMEDAETTQRKLRLQREREETELLRQEEERRRMLEEEESLDFDANETESDKPMNVGKLNIQQFSMFQQGRPVAPTAQPRKQAPKMVQEVVSVKSQQEVESAPVHMDDTDVYRGGPAVTQEDANYERRINTGKRLDVDKFLSSRSQEADERAERARRVAEERKRQEEEELAKLRLEERKRKQARSDTGYVDESDHAQTTESSRKSASSTESDSGRSRKISIEKRTSKPKEPEPETERADKVVNVGRLPEELRSQFEGERKKTSTDSHQKSSKTKGSRSSSTNSLESPRTTSTDGVSSVPHEKDMNGDVSIKGQSLDRKYSIDRREASKAEPQEQDKPIESYTMEEKPVPKKLHTSMFAAFEKGGSDPVQLRRAKSEKRVRPKSIGNVDLLKWQDDSSLRQSSSGTSPKGTTGRQPRPKSIAY